MLEDLYNGLPSIMPNGSGSARMFAMNNELRTTYKDDCTSG